MTHPGEQELALYCSGDLGRLAMWRIGFHLRSCVRCAAEAAEAETVRAAVRSHMTHLPVGLNWERLSAEMTANIHLGLEAGECVGPERVRRPERIGWRAVTVMAGITAMLMGAWWLNPPQPVRETVTMHRTPVEIRSSAAGIEVKENGSAMMLMHTRGQQSPIIVSTPGALRARFVDQDTGQVTINNVYSD